MKYRATQRDLQGKISEKGNLISELDDITAKMKIFEDSGHKSLLEDYQNTQLINDKFDTEITILEKIYP